MKYAYYYPAGHVNEGDLVAVFHECYDANGDPAKPPEQRLLDGTVLGLSEEADADLPDPPNFDIGAYKVDVTLPEVVPR